MKVQLNVLMTLHTTVLLVKDIGEVYKSLNYMSGDNLMTHQLPRVLREVKSSQVLVTAFPKLVECPEFKPGTDIPAYLQLCDIVFQGQNEFELPMLDENQHESIDAMSELAEKVHPSKILKI